jgi:transcriptional regulator with XRE-family HTH domain
MAELMDTSVTTLSRIENGKRAATAEEVERFVSLCEGVPMEFVRTGFELIVDRGRRPVQADVTERLQAVEALIKELAEILLAANSQSAARGVPMLEGELLRRLLAARPIDAGRQLPETPRGTGAQPDNGG